jgi:hypothetical protein
MLCRFGNEFATFCLTEMGTHEEMHNTDATLMGH